MALTIPPELLPPSCCNSSSSCAVAAMIWPLIVAMLACLAPTQRLGRFIHLAVLQRSQLLLLLDQLLLQILDQLTQLGYGL